MRAFMLLLAILSLCLLPAALAQDTCPAIIAAALEAVDAACNAIGRNQLCYGNVTISATPRDGAAAFEFSQPGDLVSITDVQTVQLSSFSQVRAEWGVALMRVQANLPDTLPGQNVTFLLFGNVSLTDAAGQIVEVPVTATAAVNVRQQPGTDASVITALRYGQAVTAIGRLPDSSWIQVRLDDGATGWVAADFLDGDLHRLLATEPGAPEFGPMQAFTFRTGFGDAPCEEAPASGILVQTPEGDVTISLRVNNVDIRLGSTVYLQATPGDAMYVTLIEGQATLTTHGQTQAVPAGTFATVPLDETGMASGPPTYPEPYSSAALQALPLDTGMPEEVAVQPAIPAARIPQAIDIANGLPPNGGRWMHRETTTHAPPVTCFGETNIFVGHVISELPRITFSEDRSIMYLPVPVTVTLYRTGEGSYVGRDQGGVWTISFPTPTTYVGNAVGWPENRECSWDRDIVGTYMP